MSRAHLPEERIVRNLQSAVKRLHEDMAAVELWVSALGSFAEPIPGYEPGQSRYALPPRRGGAVSSDRFRGGSMTPSRQDGRRRVNP